MDPDVTRNAAVRPPDGPHPLKFRPRGRWRLLALALAGLTACAQPTADPAAAAPQETPAMTAPGPDPARPSPPEQAGDIAAAAADRAAGPTAPAVQTTPAPPGAPRVPVPDGPALTPEELQARLLKLVEGLRSAAQTEGPPVAQALGTPLAPDPDKPDRLIAEGPLGQGGRYHVVVASVYPNVPGRRVEVRFIPPGWRGDPRNPESALTTCSLAFEPLSDAMVKLGYSRTRGPTHQRERWSFRKDFPRNAIAFYIKANLYRAQDGTAQGRSCVLSVQIDADSADLSRADLSRADLNRADLSQADLSHG